MRDKILHKQNIQHLCKRKMTETVVIPNDEAEKFCI